MGSFSIWYWLVVLVIVLLVFGIKKLISGVKDFGSVVKEFKKGMYDDDKLVVQFGDVLCLQQDVVKLLQVEYDCDLC